MHTPSTLVHYSKTVNDCPLSEDQFNFLGLILRKGSQQSGFNSPFQSWPYIVLPHIQMDYMRFSSHMWLVFSHLYSTTQMLLKAYSKLDLISA